MGFISPRFAIPTNDVLARRNAMLDWMFYNIQNLSTEELTTLISETNREGAILVVWPEGARGSLSVRKFTDFASFFAAPGDRLTRFTIAGVGSSDVGAAAFARSVANRYDTPVGAIVAGYGMTDLLSEALGGWFVLGTANRYLKKMQDAASSLSDPPQTTELYSENTSATVGRAFTDTSTLARLLKDPDRKLTSLSGHSKGCLSIAYALEQLASDNDTTSLNRNQDVRVVTTGAVISLPQAFANRAQYIGSLDWFGGMNSRLGLSHHKVSGAWHHLNTTLPTAFDFDKVLAGEPD